MRHGWRRPAGAGLFASLAIIAFSAAAPREPEGGSGAPALAGVTMSETRFLPGTVRVRRGGTVTWRNTSKIPHTVSSASFDSGTMAPGASFSRTFDRPGRYSYHCKPHQAAGMVGTVIVE